MTDFVKVGKINSQNIYKVNEFNIQLPFPKGSIYFSMGYNISKESRYDITNGSDSMYAILGYFE